MQIKFIQRFIDILRLSLDTGMIYETYKKFREFEDIKNKIETLILGSSHGYCGYVANENEYNLCLSSQDLYYSFKLYEKYQKLPKLKNIVIFYSVFSRGFELDKTNEKQRTLSYKHFFNIPILNNNFYLNLKEISFEHYYKKIKSFPINKNNGNQENYNFPPCFIPVETRVKQHYKNFQRNNYQIKWLKQLVHCAKNNFHKVYIVIPPVTNEYKINMQKISLNKNLFDDLNDLENVNIINLYDLNIFKNEDFIDWDHLNFEGAKKCTKYIRNIRNKTEKNN